MVQEDYLHCPEYENQAPHEETGFTAFQHGDSGLYFFAVMDADGHTLLKSEGYPQIAARENGIHSVIKNRTNEAFYSVKQDGERYYLSLRAANYKEIARSCHVHTEAEALDLMPYVTGQKIRKAVPPPVAPIVATAATTTTTASVAKDDDYLACKEYNNTEHHESHFVHHTHADFATFTHDSNGLHYFSWLDHNGDVLMRSEGYTQIASRDNGLQSVVHNRDLEERYSILEKLGHFFVILKAGNHQEIARSCPYATREAAMALFPSERQKVAEAAKHKHEAELAAAAIAAAAAAKLKLEQEAKAAAAAKLKLEEENRIRIAAENKHKAEIAAAAAAALAAKKIVEIPKVTVPKAAEHHVVPPAAFTQEAKSGFNWWWLALIPLLLLAWYLMKGCGADAPMPTPPPPPPVKVETPAAPVVAAPVVAAPTAKLKWIFFDYDKSNLRSASTAELDKLVAILKEHTDYKAELSAHTDDHGTDAYNDALSQRRANAAKAYLESKGISADRIKATTFGKKDPVAKNEVNGKDSEAGRQFNRRVELNVDDAKGNRLITSDAPVIASDLKEK